MQSPRVVCWQVDRSWVLGIRLPKALANDSSVLVTQGGAFLTRDSGKREYWRLVAPTGEVIIAWGNGRKRQSVRVDVGWGNPLLFRLDRRNQNWGTRVRAIGANRSWYLAIVPLEVQRDEERARTLVAPEATGWDGYKAEYFVFGDTICFKNKAAA